MTRSLARLERVQAALDAGGRLPVGASWGVDLASNTVLVSVPAGQRGLRGQGAIVRRRGPDRARPGRADPGLYGGQAIYRGRSRCSAGFNTRSGRNYVLTAGHCANLGGTWTTSGGQTIGPVAASSFPGNDYGAIRSSNPAALDPAAASSTTAPSGTSPGPAGSRSTRACKTGSTTGTTCGTVQAYNVTVNYAEGTVFGLTRPTSAPAKDSGGAMYTAAGPRASPPAAPSAAVANPGSAASSSSPTRALSAYGLTLPRYSVRPRSRPYRTASGVR